MSGICQGITWGLNDDVNSMPAAGAGYADFLSERTWLSANQSGGGNHAGIPFGELNKRVLIRQRVDMPADNFGVESQYPVTFRTWAKVIQTSATTWQETAQTGDAITHYITIRYRRGITADYEVVCGDSVYRVKRQRDLNGARRFLLLECTELGECRQSHGGSNGDSLFSR